MKAHRLSTAAISALILSGSGSATAQQLGPVISPAIQQPGGGSLFPTPIPPQTGMALPRFDHRHGSGNVIIFTDEPEVVHDVTVIHEVAAAPPAPPPAPTPRERFVIGRTYKSLPGACLKMVQAGGSYFHCSAGWFRQVGALYRAVPMP